METSEHEIPLFPLNMVLFPQMVYPLHIFEERYKDMLNTCLGSDSRFGVVLIKEGKDVGEPAVPHDWGTMARIIRCIPLDDGSFNILVMGERRVQIKEITQWLPYEKARVNFPDEVVGEPPPTKEELDSFQHLLERHLRTLMGLRGAWVREVSSPTDPIDLSFYASAVIRGERNERQRILQTPTAKERLAMLTPALQREYRRNRRRLEERFDTKGIRLN